MDTTTVVGILHLLAIAHVVLELLLISVLLTAHVFAMTSIIIRTVLPFLYARKVWLATSERLGMTVFHLSLNCQI